MLKRKEMVNNMNPINPCNDIDTAEDVLKTYERAMRDRKRQGHCLSAEWRYKANNKVTPSTFVLRYRPEVLDIVKEVLGILAANEREIFAILRVEYAYTSPYFKKSARAITQRNQRARRNSLRWYQEVEHALQIFWSYMQKHQNFEKYFKYSA